MTDRQKLDILNKADCIKELARINKASVYQFAEVQYQSPDSQKSIIIKVINNPGFISASEAIADKVFRPALTQALNEYALKLQEFIDK